MTQSVTCILNVSKSDKAEEKREQKHASRVNRVSRAAFHWLPSGGNRKNTHCRNTNSSNTETEEKDNKIYLLEVYGALENTEQREIWKPSREEIQVNFTPFSTEKYLLWARYIVNEKKFWQAPMGPWHVETWVWLHNTHLCFPFSKLGIFIATPRWQKRMCLGTNSAHPETQMSGKSWQFLTHFPKLLLETSLHSIFHLKISTILRSWK